MAVVRTLTDFFPSPLLVLLTYVTTELPVIPDNVPLSKANQYTYFRDCRHRKRLKDRWEAVKAEYLAQNPHMTNPGAQPRRIYEVRRKMAHDLGCSYSPSPPSLSTN
jgi:hypothetical protein